MRAFFELVEANRLFLKAQELAHLDASLLLALRRSGIVRDGDPGMVDISVSDLFRALRALYGLRAGGLVIPAKLGPRPMLVGWMGQHADEREVLLVLDPAAGLRLAMRRRRRALVLVPTARALTPVLRAQHPPGAIVVVEALEEVLKVRRGRLTRAGASLRDVVEKAAAPRAPGKATARRGKAASGSGAATGGTRKARAESLVPDLSGATRWNQIRICLVNRLMVRVDLPDRSVRCTPWDMGMAHKRRRVPTKVWAAFVLLCEGEGYFRTRQLGGEDATTKLVSRVRAALHDRFEISASPFHRYNSRDGWKARFQARGSLPEETTDHWLGREPE